MDILYTLIPLSVVLVLAILGFLAWAVYGGQFEDLDAEAERILLDDDRAAPPPVRRRHHNHQPRHLSALRKRQSPHRHSDPERRCNHATAPFLPPTLPRLSSSHPARLFRPFLRPVSDESASHPLPKTSQHSVSVDKTADL